MFFLYYAYMMSEQALEAPVIETADKHLIMVHGENFTKLPADLYIPPDALRVFLETFQGPLDLLLYLIKKQNIDILDIPIAKITQQYIEYMDLMHDLQLELAAEYLVMAAMLAEIKSRLLLPRPTASNEEDAEKDPRAELIRRLQEYERFKNAAEDLDRLPHCDRDIFLAGADKPPFHVPEELPTVTLPDLLTALRDVMKRAKLFSDHQIEKESLSIRERMTNILSTITGETFIEITHLFTAEEGRMGVVVTLIALLELCRQSLIEIAQSQAFAPIYVKARSSEFTQSLEIDYSQLEAFGS